MIERRELTKRFDVINPFDMDDFIAHEGYDMLKKALTMDPLKIIDEIQTARLTGRGGAGFLTAIKMNSFQTEIGVKYIVCNADEGEPGTFKDKSIIENLPGLIIEGMIIAAFVTGATKGFIYLRAEYKYLQSKLENALIDFYHHKLLGANCCGISNFNFKIERN